MINVYVVDDQALLRDSFVTIIEAQPDLTVVGAAADGAAALAGITGLTGRADYPDVVLMDVRMPVLDGLAATRRLLTEHDAGHPPAKVLMLTTFNLDDYVYSALRYGASGFLLKDAPAADLLDAIRVVARGDALLSPAVTKTLIASFVRTVPPATATPDSLAVLTAREVEVLGMVARGYSNAEIAQNLVLSKETVKTHVGRILGKLRLRDRAQAIVLAYETGLVTPAAGQRGQD